MPEVSLQPLDADCPEWGQVFVVSWDTDIFGFPVGTYVPGEARAFQATLREVGERFRAWASANLVELVSCTVPADDRAWRAILPALGFTCVEQTLGLLFRVQPYSASPPSRPVRLATVDDHPQIEEIAEHTFRHGRYNADPRFPPELADRRYRHWIRSACTSTNPADRVYVVGKPGNVKGFFQLRLVEERAEVGIMGVTESAKGSPAAFDLMTGMHLDLKALGIRWLTAKISAGNTRVINLVSHFGYRFRDAQATFHWHAPGAPHLLPPGAIPGSGRSGHPVPVRVEDRQESEQEA
jgi:hypothetical protein